MKEIRKAAVGGFLATVLGLCLWALYVWFYVDFLHISLEIELKYDAWIMGHLGDAWERKAGQIAGRKAVNCGWVHIHDDPTSENECAVAAFSNHQPFHIRYDLRGIDSKASAGLVFSPTQGLYELDWDGDPMGRGGVSPRRQRAYAVRCPRPFSLRVNLRGRVTCYAENQEDAGSVMSPKVEAY